MADFALDIAAESIGGIVGARSNHVFPWLASKLPANRALRGEMHLEAARKLLEQDIPLFDRMNKQLLLNAHTAFKTARTARQKFDDSKWILSRWSTSRIYEEQGIIAWKTASTASSKTREEILSLVIRPYLADLQAAESAKTSVESRNVLKKLYRRLRTKQMPPLSNGIELSDISHVESYEDAHAENPFDYGDDASELLQPYRPLGSIQEVDGERSSGAEHPSAPVRNIRRYSV